MIDIGPNLCNERFNSDLSNVIDRAIETNVSGLILTTTDNITYNKNLKIINDFNHKIHLYTTYGLHPHNASKHHNTFIDIEKKLNNPYVIAIGEFGLDYFRMISPKEIQLYVMNKFLEIAQSFPDLPLFLHERESYQDFYQLLKESKLNNKSVVHCFTGNSSQLKSYIDLGCFIGITGWITDPKRNHNLIDALKYLPLDRLMIETDCPYLTPKNMHVNCLRNEPSFLLYIAKNIAEIINVPIQNIIDITTKNSLDFFSINDYNKKHVKKILG